MNLAMIRPLRGGNINARSIGCRHRNGRSLGYLET
jgi:hypothetical protein